MKRLTNTIKEDISVTIFGENYTLPEGGYIDLPKETALYWVKNLHTFLTISDVPTKEVKPEVKEDEVKEVEIVEKIKKVIKK